MLFVTRRSALSPHCAQSRVLGMLSAAKQWPCKVDQAFLISRIYTSRYRDISQPHRRTARTVNGLHLVLASAAYTTATVTTQREPRRISAMSSYILYVHRTYVHEVYETLYEQCVQRTLYE